jgi:hypothetical protein
MKPDSSINPEEVRQQCGACKGVAHPATGCAWSDRTLVCGPCARSFWKWMIGHTNQRRRFKKGKPSPDFYGAALSSPSDEQYNGY